MQQAQCMINSDDENISHPQSAPFYNSYHYFSWQTETRESGARFKLHRQLQGAEMTHNVMQLWFFWGIILYILRKYTCRRMWAVGYQLTAVHSARGTTTDQPPRWTAIHTGPAPPTSSSTARERGLGTQMTLLCLYIIRMWPELAGCIRTVHINVFTCILYGCYYRGDGMTAACYVLPVDMHGNNNSSSLGRDRRNREVTK